VQDLATAALITLGLLALAGYLLGSIPFGLFITRAGGAGDIRTIGSGNIGATNVLRTGRKDLAALTLILDAGKGAAAVLIARELFGGDLAAAIAGGAAFVGHLFPVWLKFRGGKGVATFFGVALSVLWPMGLLCAVTWLAVAFLMRISSLAALVAAAAAPLYALALGAPAPILSLTVFMAVLIFIRHHDNISRLARGTEPRIGAGKA